MSEAPAASPAPTSGPVDDVALAAELGDKKRALISEIKKRIIGQERVVELLLITLFADGHGLFVGVPGLAKTLLIQTLSDALGLNFQRIQFTPDLMPSDITGTEVLEEDRTTGKRSFRFIPGPLFANIVLADEVNRTPPKTQAALLQAMQERKITAGGRTHDLSPPFLVFATQNPIEQEGTYPLPEAQLDRFMLMIDVGYPSHDEEVAIVQATTATAPAPVQPVLTQAEVRAFQALVRRVPAPPSVVEYAVRLVRKTRPESGSVSSELKWGAGPRASQMLIMGAKARAVLDGRPSAAVEDVQALAPYVLAHRVVLHYAALAEGLTPKEIIGRIVQDTAG